MSKKNDIADMALVVERLIERVKLLSNQNFHLENRIGILEDKENLLKIQLNDRITCANNNCDTLFSERIIPLEERQYEERHKQEIINNKGLTFMFHEEEERFFFNDVEVNLEKYTPKTKTISFDLFLVKYTVELVEVRSKVGNLFRVKEVSYKGKEN